MNFVKENVSKHESHKRKKKRKKEVIREINIFIWKERIRERKKLYIKGNERNRRWKKEVIYEIMKDVEVKKTNKDEDVLDKKRRKKEKIRK